MHFLFPLLGAVLPLFTTFAGGVELDPDNEASIAAAASQYAFGLMSYYKGNASGLPKEDIGVFPKPPYYWWEGGAAWGAMIEYTHFIGDASYVDTLTQALVANYGPDKNILLEWKKDQEGNDDQAFWALSLMSAVEYQFPDPADAPASYLEVAVNAFNNVVSRWDTASCNGGFKWQIYPENPANGYHYKNAISNGAIFALGARLARYTGNQTYADWSVRIWDWSKAIGLIGDDYQVFDGTDDKKNCTELNHMEWSYNIGMYTHGAAVMYNLTNGSSSWKTHVSGFLAHTAAFFTPYENATDIMYEPLCETADTERVCNVDQYSFKAYLSRFLAKTAIMAPFTKPQVERWLRTSAVAAAKACTGGEDGTTCGHQWYTGEWDGTDGVGQQMNALEVTQALLTLRRGIVPERAGQVQPQPSSPSIPVSEAPLTPTPPTSAPADDSTPGPVSSADSTLANLPPAPSAVVNATTADLASPTSVTLEPISSASPESATAVDGNVPGARPQQTTTTTTTASGESTSSTNPTPSFVFLTTFVPGPVSTGTSLAPPAASTGVEVFPGMATNSRVAGRSLLITVALIVMAGFA